MNKTKDEVKKKIYTYIIDLFKVWVYIQFKFLDS